MASKRLLCILHDFMKEKENKRCADCSSRTATWVSTTFGIFVCINCSGIHRSFGSHISKVKSVLYDTKWSKREINQMLKWGNRRANSVFAPRRYKRLTWNRDPEANIIEFIKDKYVRRKWERIPEKVGEKKDESKKKTNVVDGDEDGKKKKVDRDNENKRDESKKVTKVEELLKFDDVEKKKEDEDLFSFITENTSRSCGANPREEKKDVNVTASLNILDFGRFEVQKKQQIPEQTKVKQKEKILAPDDFSSRAANILLQFDIEEKKKEVREKWKRSGMTYVMGNGIHHDYARPQMQEFGMNTVGPNRGYPVNSQVGIPQVGYRRQQNLYGGMRQNVPDCFNPGKLL